MSLILPNTDKKYYIYTNALVLSDKLIELGYDNTILKPQKGLNPANIDTLKQSGKHLCMVLYWDSYEVKKEVATIEQINIGYSIFTSRMYEKKFGCKINSVTEFAAELEHHPRIPEEFIEELGLQMSTYYVGKCGNCHKTIDSDDKYCKYCGTKNGEGAFLPYNNALQFAYGSPMIKQYQCPKCGLKWQEISVGRDRRYCKECGILANLQSIEEYDTFGFKEIFKDLFEGEQA